MTAITLSPPPAALLQVHRGWPWLAQRSPAPSRRCCRSSIRIISGCPRAGLPLDSHLRDPGNAINDPLFGYITYSTRSKRGRRIPYMRFTAGLFLALTFILVWFAPQGIGDPGLFAWMLGAMLLYDTCYTVIGVVYSALLPEITESDADLNAASRCRRRSSACSACCSASSSLSCSGLRRAPPRPSSPCKSP